MLNDQPSAKPTKRAQRAGGVAPRRAPVDAEVAELRRQLRIEHITKEIAALETQFKGMREKLSVNLWVALLSSKEVHERVDFANDPLLWEDFREPKCREAIDAAFRAGMKVFDEQLARSTRSAIDPLQVELKGLQDVPRVSPAAASSARKLLDSLTSGRSGQERCAGGDHV
jgi:hypothetical protein